MIDDKVGADPQPAAVIRDKVERVDPVGRHLEIAGESQRKAVIAFPHVEVESRCSTRCGGTELLEVRQALPATFVVRVCQPGHCIGDLDSFTRAQLSEVELGDAGRAAICQESLHFDNRRVREAHRLDVLRRRLPRITAINCVADDAATKWVVQYKFRGVFKDSLSRDALRWRQEVRHAECVQTLVVRLHPVREVVPVARLLRRPADFRQCAQPWEHLPINALLRGMLGPHVAFETEYVAGLLRCESRRRGLEFV